MPLTGIGTHTRGLGLNPLSGRDSTEAAVRVAYGRPCPDNRLQASVFSAAQEPKLSGGFFSMNTKSIVACAGAVALFSGSAMAELPSYNYLEVAISGGDYQGTELPVNNIHVGGYDIDGSMVISDSILLRASVSGLDEDISGAELEIDSFDISIGTIKEVGENTIFDLSLQYRDDEAELEDFGEVEFDGPVLLMGLRSNVSDTVEVYGRIGYLLGNYEGGTSTDLGLVWNFSDSFAATFNYEVTDVDDDDVEYQLDQWQIGGRWKF